MTLTIEVRSKPGKVNELYQTLQALLPTMRKEKGCQACRVTRDVEDGELFFLSSEWDAPGGFDGYMRSGSGSALFGAIDLLGESARVRTGADERNPEADQEGKLILPDAKNCQSL
jgi:quinol monooxygenase YgiN